MMHTFAKLRAPRPGRGQAKLEFDAAFDKLDPDIQASMLDQFMKLARAKRDRAAILSASKFNHEDHVCAEHIRPRQAS